MAAPGAGVTGSDETDSQGDNVLAKDDVTFDTTAEDIRRDGGCFFS